MSDHNNREDYKERVASVFNLVASGYDHPALRFFPFCADRLIQRLKISRGEKVLDVATGTGAAAVAAAQLVGPEGRVVGIDIAEAMLDRAHEKSQVLGFNNIDLHVMDAELLEFRGKYFDSVICSFGIFFLSDMHTGLREWRRVVRPGGRVLFTCFGHAAFQPLADMFYDRIERYGVKSAGGKPRTAIQRLTDPAACRRLLAEADLEDVDVATEQLGYYLNDAGEWWDIVWNAGFRGLVAQLSPADQQEFKAEHLAEVADLTSVKGVWLNVETIFASGRRRSNG